MHRTRLDLGLLLPEVPDDRDARGVRPRRVSDSSTRSPLVDANRESQWISISTYRCADLPEKVGWVAFVKRLRHFPESPALEVDPPNTSFGSRMTRSAYRRRLSGMCCTSSEQTAAFESRSRRYARTPARGPSRVRAPERVRQTPEPTSALRMWAGVAFLAGAR
jgi:hypothetical protein